jgi:hypothetical protein
MARFYVLLLLLLSACGAAPEAAAVAEESAPVVAEPAPQPEAAAAKPEIWLPEGHPAKAAQDLWGLPLSCNLEVVEVPGSDAAVACGREPVKGSYVGGCADYRACKIIVPAEQTPVARATVLRHEIGHIYRNGQGHPTEGCPEGKPGLHVMCANGQAEIAPPDSVDYAFVLHEAPYNQ